jgi:hypothetical protein
VKSTLSEGCLRHILSVESAKDSGWLEHAALADQVDSYLANRMFDKPNANYAIGAKAYEKPTEDDRLSLPQ